MNASADPGPIPITLLTGFLGSGKTTVLNHLVRQPALASALVIINEFGEIGLDHLLVAHSAETQVVEMSSGCLCCTIRTDLVTTLRDITWRFARGGRRQFDRVLIETTGLADPAPIIHTLMSNPSITSRYRLDGIIATVDLATGMQTLDQHAESLKQVAVADVLLLTKADLVSDMARAELERRLHDINPAAVRLSVRDGAVATDALLNLGLFTTDGKPADVERWLAHDTYRDASPTNDHHEHNHHDVNRHDDHIRAYCFSIHEVITEAQCSAWLKRLSKLAGSKLLRMKGILNIKGRPGPTVIHGVQHVFHPPVHLSAWPDDDHCSRLVFITRDIDRTVIETALGL